MSQIVTILKEHWEYRKQILKLAKADLVKTYRGAALGWSWAIIKPTITIFVYWFAFTIGLRAGKPVNGYPFFLWLIAGLIPWFYMSDMIVSGANCIRRYNYLVTKMKYPVSTIPTFVNLSKLAITLILIVIMIIIFALFGFKPDIYLLQLPIYILLAFLLFNLWGFFASFLGAISKDFINLVKSFLTALFWLSAVLWNSNKVSNGWVKKFLNLNPITFISNGFRNCFIDKVWIWEQPKRLLYFVIILVILLVLGLWAYKKLRKDIPDVL